VAARFSCALQSCTATQIFNLAALSLSTISKASLLKVCGFPIIEDTMTVRCTTFVFPFHFSLVLMCRVALLSVLISCFCSPGGVIFAKNSKVAFKNCFFINNRALSEGRGSAIFSLNSDITIEGSVFLNHNSKGNGGVIYAAQNSNVAIRHSFFESKSHLLLLICLVIDCHLEKFC
jgi:hypothetical protein